MPITEHPLRGSVRALLMHTALTLSNDAHSPERIGMMEFNLRKPQIDKSLHLFPWQLVAVASASQSSPPQLRDGKAKDHHGMLVTWDSVIPVMSLDHTLQPFALIFDRVVHSLAHLLLYFRQFYSHLFTDCSSEDRVHAVAALYPNNVNKTQEAKSFWFVLFSTFPIVDRKWAKFQNSRLFRMKLKTKLVHSLLQICQKIFSLGLVFKSNHKVIGPSHNDDFTARFVFSFVINPKIERVMKVNVRKQGAYAPALWHTLIRFFFDSFNHNTRLQPFSDQADHTIISNPVFNKFDQPLVIQAVEEPLDVSIHNPVHFTCQKSHVERIETVMLTLPRSVPIGKSQEISFINRIHDFHGRPLDKLVLNYWNAQGTLLAVGFVDEHSTHWLGFISSSFQSLREVLKIALQIFFVVFPRYFVDACCRLLFHLKEANIFEIVHGVMSLRRQVGC